MLDLILLLLIVCIFLKLAIREKWAFIDRSKLSI